MTEKTTSPENPNQKSPNTVEKNAQQIMAERKAAQQSTVASKAADTPDNKSAKEDKSEKKVSAPNWSLRILLILLVFILGSSTGIYFLPQLQDRLPILKTWIGTEKSLSPDNSALTQKITALERRLENTEQDLLTVKRNYTGLSQQIEALPQNSPQTTSPGSDPALLERIDRLEKARLTDKKSTEDSGQSARIDMLLSRMSQLESSFVPLSKGLADAQEARIERRQLAEKSAATETQLDQIEDRLRHVERYAARDNKGALLAFRIGELRRKIMSGQEFSTEITQLKHLTQQGTFANNAPLQGGIRWLSLHTQGISSREKLRDDFFNLIPAVIRAEANPKDDPWWKRAYNSTKNLIILRKTDARDPANFDGLIASAQDMLERLDLPAALELVKSLPEGARIALDIWIMRAEMALRADEELNRIESLSAAYYLSPEITPEKTPQPQSDEEETSL